MLGISGTQCNSEHMSRCGQSLLTLTYQQE